MTIRAVISDFGGVLTTPLMNSFAAVQDHTGIAPEVLGRAMQAVAEREGKHPLFELEKGNVTEAEFLSTLAAELRDLLDHEPELHRFRDVYFEALDPNHEMVGLMREVKGRGYRTALLTNNVREWEPLWRSMLPVDEIFELVVDSAFVGMRKPERGIYELTLERLRAHDPGELGGLDFGECLFVDDVDVNVEAARELGMQVVHFRETEQAVAEVRAALGL
jgi:haloacid dehalogenase superfamily, subfamily IA, variant 3 with third motif having DD or ED